MHDAPVVPEITALELARTLESGSPLQIIDVRAPARIAAGRIDTVPEGRFHAILGSRLVAKQDLADTGIDPGILAAVVCGHGNDSRVVAAHLGRLGLDARSVVGGMAAWMSVVIPRELEPPPSLDRMIQFDRIGKGALGYLLMSGDEALIVDPPRAASAYLEAAREAGAQVVGIADTHVHADYVSGATALARTLGVPYYLHPADAVYPYDGTPGRLEFHALRDGEAIRFGRCVVKACHTPGHTEGSLCLLVDDAVALTGDFLFVASIGRPDLAGKVSEWTEQLWESVVRAKREWPPGIRIYPAHYGSAGEREPDRSVGASLARLLERNPSLRLEDHAAFVAWVKGQATSFPESYRTIKAVNVGLVPVDAHMADELEVGRNECALGGA